MGWQVELLRNRLRNRCQRRFGHNAHLIGIGTWRQLKIRRRLRGQILGDQTGKLKLLFDPRSLKLLGLHIIGEGATELVHIGQAILNTGATIEYFRDTVFNYPTYAEAYKVAAQDGLSRLPRPGV